MRTWKSKPVYPSRSVPLRGLGFGAVMLLFCFGLVGCDAVGDNAAEEAPLASVAEAGPHPFDAAGVEVPVEPSIIDGTWFYVPTDYSETGKVTFTTRRVINKEKGLIHRGRLEGATRCSEFTGRFRIRDEEERYRMWITNLAVTPTRCDVLAEEPLIAGLRTATEFHMRNDGFLVIVNDALGEIVLGPGGNWNDAEDEQ